MKPREFALKVRPWETQAFSWDEANPNALVTGETIHVREVLPATECADLEELLAERNRQAQLAAANYDRINGLRNAAIAERDEAIAACALALRDFDAGGLHHLSAEAAGELRAVLAKAKGRAE